MADEGFDDLAKLAKRAMVLDDLKVWIVAETATARGLEANPTIASAGALARTLPRGSASTA